MHPLEAPRRSLPGRAGAEPFRGIPGEAMLDISPPNRGNGLAMFGTSTHVGTPLDTSALTRHYVKPALKRADGTQRGPSTP